MFSHTGVGALLPCFSCVIWLCGCSKPSRSLMYATLVLLVVLLQNISRSTTTTTHIVENKYKFISKACDFFKVPRFAFISSSSLPPSATLGELAGALLSRVSTPMTTLHHTSAAKAISSSFNSTQHSVHSALSHSSCDEAIALDSESTLSSCLTSFEGSYLFSPYVCDSSSDNRSLVFGEEFSLVFLFSYCFCVRRTRQSGGRRLNCRIIR